MGYGYNAYFTAYGGTCTTGIITTGVISEFCRLSRCCTSSQLDKELIDIFLLDSFARCGMASEHAHQLVPDIYIS